MKNLGKVSTDFELKLIANFHKNQEKKFLFESPMRTSMLKGQAIP